MKNILLVLLTLGTFNAVQAQKNYSLEPSNKGTWTIDPTNQAEMSIYIKNTSLSPVTISYKIIGNTLPASWYTSICDNNLCWDPLPTDTNDFSPIQPGEKAYLKLQASPNNKKGSGVVTVWLYEKGNPTKSDTLLYYVNLLWNSGITAVKKGELMVSPNPCKNRVEVIGVIAKTPFSIYDLNGKLVLSGILNPSEQTIDISLLSSGVYVLQTQSLGLPAQAQRLVVE